MNGFPDPTRLDALQHQIDALTPRVGELTRAEVVTWCLINYMAGARDLFVEDGDGLPWEALADPVHGQAARRDIAVSLTARINELITTTTTGGPGINPDPGS